MDWVVSILVYSTVGIPLLAVFYINRKAIHAHIRKHIGVFLIAVGMVYSAVMTFLFLYPPINSAFGYAYFPDFIRNLILGIGGLGGFYGLVLASRRGKTFDKQVAGQERQIEEFANQVGAQRDQVQSLVEQVETQKIQANTAQEQLFNERLSRGIEQLGKGDNVTMRRAGVRLLDELARSSSDQQKKQVISILHDYIVGSARKRGEGEDNYIPRHERMDIELAVELVVDLAKEAGLRMYDIGFASLDFSGLEFRSKRNLEEVWMREASLKRTDFSFSSMNRADFRNAELFDADFFCAQLMEAQFASANLTESRLFDANLTGAYFRFSRLERTFFSGSDCTGADFQNSHLSGAHFFNCDCSGADFTDAKDWSPGQFKDIAFEESNPPKLPDGMKPPEDRAYKIVKDGDKEKKEFVLSGKPFVAISF